MKKYILALVTVGAMCGLCRPQVVTANEGVVNLRGAGTAGSCFATSVFIDGTYKVLMTCRELKIALSPEKNRYVAWVQDDAGKQRRLGEIANGKLSSLTDGKFVRMLVTVESDGYGNTPSDDLLLGGAVEPINFGPGVVTTPILTPTPTMSTTRSQLPTITPVVTQSSQNSSGLGSALSTIFKIALMGFGILLLVVGVFSFLSRRRSL